MNKHLIVDSEKCTGCGLCQLACAIKNSGQCEPSLARITIWKDETKGLFVPMVCQQCETPPCADVCLMNIISKEPGTGLTIRNMDGCIACRACQAACPFEACHYDYLREAVVNCDHCGGSPECVKYCPYGALQYADLDDVLDNRRYSEALRRVCI